MRLLLLYALFLTFFSSYAQPIVYVTESGRGDGSGTSWTNALPGTSLANRVSTAAAGTNFWIAGGTYKPTTTTDRTASFSIASGISLYGGFVGSETSIDQRTYQNITRDYATILSGRLTEQERSIRVVSIQDATQPIKLEGLTITGGQITGYDYASSGAGLNVRLRGRSQLNLTISVCKFYGNFIWNTLSVGGAIAIRTEDDSKAVVQIHHCSFDNNRAGSGGAYGALFLGGSIQTEFDDCGFLGNSSSSSGAGAIDNSLTSPAPSNSLTIRRCRFSGNQADSRGGAIITGRQPILISDSQFKNNSVLYSWDVGGRGGGGAIDASGCLLAQYQNCSFANNSAFRGGAIYSTSVNDATEQRFLNCTFANNTASISGGAFFNDQYGDMRPGSSYAVPNNTHLTNCILWGNSAPNSPAYYAVYGSEYGNRPITNYSLVQDLNPEIYIGTNNLSTDPRFIDSQAGNYRLQSSSPAINAGDPKRPDFLLNTDLDGNPRLQGGRVDIGAYEFDCDVNACAPFMVRRSR